MLCHARPLSLSRPRSHTQRRVCATHGTARAVRCGVGRVRACLLNQDGACRAQFLSPDAAKDLVDKENALLLDVREDYEFAEVCISTSVNRDLLEQKERPIRHYSSTGTTNNREVRRQHPCDQCAAETEQRLMVTVRVCWRWLLGGRAMRRLPSTSRFRSSWIGCRSVLRPVLRPICGPIILPCTRPRSAFMSVAFCTWCM